MTDTVSDRDTIVAPWLITELSDYPPGSTVNISLGGFTVGEAVTFQVNLLGAGADGVYGTADDVLLPAPAGVMSWTVIDGGAGDANGLADGLISTTWYVDPAYANTTIVLTATAMVAGADGTLVPTGEVASVVFTDSAAPAQPVTDPDPPAQNLAPDDGGADSVTANGGAIFFNQVAKGTGSGVFPSFLRIQNNGTEQGFNTDANPLPLDDVNSHVLTHSITLSQMGLADAEGNPVTAGYLGTTYRVFHLDMAQNGPNPYLSLDAFQIYQAATGDIATLPDLKLSSLQYSLSGWIELEDVAAGNGQSDYTVLIPDSVFDHTGDIPYVYLYSKFGAETSAEGSLTANSSFEEWSYLAAPAFVPPGQAALSIVKVTNDGSASGDGLTILAGESISWTYTVTNAGAATSYIADVLVSDNQSGVTPTYVSGDANNDHILQYGETWVFSANGIATVGDYANIGTVTGNGTNGSGGYTPLTKTDPSSYFGADPQISIVKLTNGSDTGTYLVGSAITWTYAVKNTGNVALGPPTVVDDKLGAITNYTGDIDNDSILSVGETWTYSTTGTAVADGYINLGTATDSFTDDAGHTKPLSVSDPSGYFGADPQIAIQKVTLDGTTSAATVASDYAAGGDGRTILSGEAVSWIYAVTNVGNVALSSVGVADSVAGVNPTYLTGDTNSDSKLETGETWFYSATGTVGIGQYGNTGTASGSFTDDAGHTGSDTASDTSSYFGANPQIKIDKTTTGYISASNTTTGDGISVLAGYGVSWTYTVTNIGNVALSGVAVTDNQSGVAPTYVSGDANSDGKLDLTETWRYTASGTAVYGSYSNIGKASGSFTDTAGHVGTPSATDPSSYIGTFKLGAGGLTIGYWYTHQSLWSIPSGGVRGDVLLGSGASPVGGSLSVPKLAAIQLINSSQTANDTRQILMSQAEATQLNINAGANDPGGLSPGRDLISEAVYWLEDRNLKDGSPSFIYADHHSGNVDATHNGKVDTLAGGTLASGYDYNSTAKAFTFEGADGFQVANKVLTSSTNAWQTLLDTGVGTGVSHQDFAVNGEGLKNALMYFNQNMLVTSKDGLQIGWNASGAVGGIPTDIHANNAAGMWAVLNDQHIKGIGVVTVPVTV
jgi:hypothetical protein